MRTALAIILVNACFFLGTCSTPPNQLQLVRETGVLKVVSRNGSTTFYLGSEGPSGFEYDLAKGFAEYLGVELNIYSAIHFSDILDDVTLWRADIAAAGLTITPERARKVRFSQAYREVRPQLVYRLGHRRPALPADLVGKRIAVPATSSFVEVLDELAAEVEGLMWDEVASADVHELLQRVVDDEIDYTIIDSNEYEIASQYYPELRVAFDVSAPTNLGWALRRGADDSLYRAVKAYLAKARASGLLARIDERYYDNTHRLDYVGTRRYLRHIESRLPQFRENFEQAAAANDLDWRLLAAVGYQESRWNPKAVSPTGVRGLMMLTRATARQLGVDNRTDPSESIAGGARYLVRVKKKIPKRIDEPDRTFFALAAYNVGFLHLEDARIITQMQGKNPDDWKDVREHLPLLAQEKWHKQVKRGYARGWEPVRYVDNIRSYYDILTWATSDQYRGVQQAKAPAKEKSGNTESAAL